MYPASNNNGFPEVEVGWEEYSDDDWTDLLDLTWWEDDRWDEDDEDTDDIFACND